MTASATTSRKSGAREGGGNACRSPRHHRHRHPRKPPLPGGRQASPPLPAFYLCHCLQPPNGAHTSGHLPPPPSPPFRYNASTHAARASSQAASSASPSARRPRTQSPLAPPHRQPPPPAAPPPALLRPGRATPPPPPRRLKNPPATLTKALGRPPIGGVSRHVDCVVKIGAAAPNAPAPTVSARGGGRRRRLSRRRRFRRRPPRVDDNFKCPSPSLSDMSPPAEGRRRSPRPPRLPLPPACPPPPPTQTGGHDGGVGTQPATYAGRLVGCTCTATLEGGGDWGKRGVGSGGASRLGVRSDREERPQCCGGRTEGWGWWPHRRRHGSCARGAPAATTAACARGGEGRASVRRGEELAEGEVPQPHRRPYMCPLRHQMSTSELTPTSFMSRVCWQGACTAKSTRMERACSPRPTTLSEGAPFSPSPPTPAQGPAVSPSIIAWPIHPIPPTPA